MDLTLLANVKALADITSTGEDVNLSTLITSVSKRAEEYMRRHAQSQSRTEILRWPRFKETLWLKAFPIAVVTSIKYTGSPNQFSTISAMSSSLYYTDTTTGEVEFLQDMSLEKGWLQVIYTGGMSDTPANFVTAYPDIANAVDKQVLYEWRRRKDPGLASKSTQSGERRYVGSRLGGSSQLTWLDDTLAVLDSYARRQW